MRIWNDKKQGLRPAFIMMLPFATYIGYVCLGIIFIFQSAQPKSIFNLQDNVHNPHDVGDGDVIIAIHIGVFFMELGIAFIPQNVIDGEHDIGNIDLAVDVHVTHTGGDAEGEVTSAPREG